MTTQNYEAIFSTNSEEQATQGKQVTALWAEVEELQAKMAEMKKLNYELAQCVQVKKHVNVPINPEIQQPGMNEHRDKSIEERIHSIPAWVNSEIRVPHRKKIEKGSMLGQGMESQKLDKKWSRKKILISIRNLKIINTTHKMI